MAHPVAPDGGIVPADTAGALAGVFPPGVAAQVVPVAAAATSGVHPDEQAVADTFGPRRRHEFLAGRACARVVLHRLGVTGAPVGRGARREPRWPPGIVGSLSHAQGWVAAVAAHEDDAWALGVDLEPVGPPLDEAVDRLVRTAAERAAEGAGAQQARLVFCAKECVFKALSPRTGWPLAFHDVVVELDPAAGCWVARVDARFRLDGHCLPPLQGRFAVSDGLVLAGLHVPPDGPVSAHDDATRSRGQGVSRSGPRNR